MNAMIKSHKEEIRAVMQRTLKGEMAEADAARTIIILQGEMIATLMTLSHLSTEAPAGLMEESTLQFRSAA